MASRRRSHPVKLVAAAVVLAASVAVAAAGVIAATVTALTIATGLTMVAGCAVAALMFAEIVSLRRAAARDRAALAGRYRDETRARSADHQVFVERVGEQIAARDTEIDRQRTELERLRAAAVDAEILLVRARERVSAEQGRVAELLDDARATGEELQTARADLARAQDALTASEAAGVAAQAEITAWELATGSSSPDAVLGTRRSA